MAIYLAMLLIDLGGVSLEIGFGLLGPSGTSAFRFGASGVDPVLRLGRWWTVLSAGWLHGSLLHIGFNMMFAWQLLPLAMKVYGVGRGVIVYVLASAAGFMASTFAVFLPVQIPLLHPAPLTLGASAANLGLLGALVWYGRRSGNSMFGQQMLALRGRQHRDGLRAPGRRQLGASRRLRRWLAARRASSIRCARSAATTWRSRWCCCCCRRARSWRRFWSTLPSGGGHDRAMTRDFSPRRNNGRRADVVVSFVPLNNVPELCIIMPSHRSGDDGAGSR